VWPRAGGPPASLDRAVVDLWWRGGLVGYVFFFSRGCQVRNWWLTFRLAGDNILRLCWMNSWLVLIWLLNTSRKKKGFRDTICLARLSGWGDSLFFFMDFVLFARVAWSTGYR